jgi:hypothetical protein
VLAPPSISPNEKSNASSCRRLLSTSAITWHLINQIGSIWQRFITTLRLMYDLRGPAGRKVYGPK